MESHKIHVPNHQPDIYLFPNEITVGKTWFKSQMFGNLYLAIPDSMSAK
jgi:hypothetical protein